MDSTSMATAIIKVIKQSNMSDIDLISVNARNVQITSDNRGSENPIIHLNLTDSIGNTKTQLSEAWVAGIILLFSAFDGYLEKKYNLTEGDSFKKHYDNLPQTSELEKIQKDCYRILKLIRNGIQHNLSSVNNSNGACIISYNYKTISYELEISKNGLKNLYTIVMNIIDGKIYGLEDEYLTQGHQIGIINTMYYRLRREISHISDDIGMFINNVDNDITYDSKHIRDTIRYIVNNPIIILEDENKIVFKHYESNPTDDENNSQYQYSTDYVYNGYLLPQEMGIIKKI